MQALTDKIVSQLNHQIDNCGHSKEVISGINIAVSVIKEMEADAEFEEIARIMMKHLGNGNKYCPHHSVIICNSSAELVLGEKCTGQVMDYVPD